MKAKELAPPQHLHRIAPPFKAPLKKNLLLISPRQTGKSFFMRSLPQVDLYLNLQEADTFRKFSYQKNLLENLLTENIKTIALDHFHRLPSILDQVLHLNKTRGVRFILAASQTKSFDLGHEVLSHDYTEVISFLPFCYPEYGVHYDLNSILRYGSLPLVFGKDHADVLLNDYIGLLFQEELVQAVKIKKVENFSRFLNSAALANGEYLNYESVADACEVPSRTVREYYELLKTSLLGYEIPSYQGLAKRKSAKKSKFYFFDLGVTQAFKNDFSFESDFERVQNGLKHLILLELIAYKNYRRPDLKIECWCNYQGHEIDFVINESVAIEVKSTTALNLTHSKRMKHFIEKGALKKHFLLSQDSKSASVDQIDYLPVLEFLRQLWLGQVFKA